MAVGIVVAVISSAACSGADDVTAAELEERLAVLQAEVERTATVTSMPSSSSSSPAAVEQHESSLAIPLLPDECVVRVERTCIDAHTTDLDGDGATDSLMVVGHTAGESSGELSALTFNVRLATGATHAVPLLERPDRASPYQAPRFVGQTDIDGDRFADVFFVHLDHNTDAETYGAYFVHGGGAIVPDLDPLILALPAGLRGVGWIECVDGEDGNPGELTARTARPADPASPEGVHTLTTDTYGWDLADPTAPRLSVLSQEQTTVDGNPFADVPAVFSCGFGFD